MGNGMEMWVPESIGKSKGAKFGAQNAEAISKDCRVRFTIGHL